MADKDELARRIGSRLKELRKQAGLTLKRLAEETELSHPLLSRIENGLAMPSIPTLKVIADTLKVDIGYFFHKEEEKGYSVSCSGSRRIGVSDKGYEIELMAEGMENPFMEPAIVTLMGKDQDEDVVGLATHEGQEFMYVLEGRMELSLGTKKFALKKGDAAYWKGSIPHRGVSLSKKPARTLNVHLVPGKRAGTFQTKD